MIVCFGTLGETTPEPQESSSLGQLPLFERIGQALGYTASPSDPDAAEVIATSPDTLSSPRRELLLLSQQLQTTAGQHLAVLKLRLELRQYC